MLRCAMLIAFIGATASPLAAQAATGDEPRWALVPQVSVGKVGHRWEIAGPDGGRLGPGSAPAFGLGLLRDPRARIGLEARTAISFHDYSIDFTDESGETMERIRGAGSIQLLRLGAGAVFRVRPDVPGYFAGGVGALYYRPTRRITAGGRPLFDDEAQWMPALHAGAGIDATADGHTLRVDVRGWASRPTQDAVRHGGDRFAARGMVLDLLVSLGYLLRF